MTKQTTSERLDTIMLEGLERHKKEEITNANLNATGSMVGKFIAKAKLEVEYHRLRGETPAVEFFGQGK